MKTTYCQCNTLGVWILGYITRIKGSQQHSNNQTCFKSVTSQILRKTTTITHQKLRMRQKKGIGIRFGALFRISFGEKTSTVNGKSSKSILILPMETDNHLFIEKTSYDTKHSGTLEEQQGNHEVCSLAFSLLREKQKGLCCFQNKRIYHQSHVRHQVYGTRMIINDPQLFNHYKLIIMFIINFHQYSANSSSHDFLVSPHGIGLLQGNI